MDNELFFAFNYLNEVKEKINPLKEESASAFICMLAEEYCKANNKNVVDFFTDLMDAIKAVNEDLGKYK